MPIAISACVSQAFVNGAQTVTCTGHLIASDTTNHRYTGHSQPLQCYLVYELPPLTPHKTCAVSQVPLHCHVCVPCCYAQHPTWCPSHHKAQPEEAVRWVRCVGAVPGVCKVVQLAMTCSEHCPHSEHWGPCIMQWVLYDTAAAGKFAFCDSVLSPELRSVQPCPD